MRVPVLFGGECGPDLGEVAAHTGLTEDEVVKRYCDSPLYCYMNGFTPGFPYLGGMDPALTTPRLKTPRELIPANSVAIGGAQAGAYSIASPGGASSAASPTTSTTRGAIRPWRSRRGCG